MVGMEILKPVVVLAAWTMVMWVWMIATRIPAMGKTGIDSKGLVGGTGESLDKVLPPEVQWKAHNYNHLHEAPTVFYAVAIVLAIIGHGDGLNAAVAWAYVGVRIVHSVFQATINKVIPRFALFVVSSLLLMILIFHAAIPIFDWHLYG